MKTIESPQRAEYRFLIIAGTSKAGTTSVFNYFAGHPQICPAEKETRFFLDPSYPLPSRHRYRKRGGPTYVSLFAPGPSQNWRFEATPDYLYSAGTAHNIRQSVSNACIVFILREPISRLLSWYRFGRSMNVIPAVLTFDGYVALQKRLGGVFREGYKHPAFAALQHGRYSSYLKCFVETFGSSNVWVFFYEDLQRNALQFVKSLCHAFRLDEGYFEGRQFEIINKGQDVRSRYLRKGYFKAKQQLRRLVQGAPTLRGWLAHVRPQVDRRYNKINVIGGQKVAMSSATKTYLEDYYRNEPAQLNALLGIHVPWNSDREKALGGVEVTD